MIDRKMDQKILIRRTGQTDIPAIEILYHRAFADEDLFPLVIALLEDEQNTRMLCAVSDGLVIGHIAFTKCHAMPKNIPLSLLGPLAVLPDWQRQGVGSRLIAEGFSFLKTDGIAKILVLGDPDFYHRAGFAQEQNIRPPFTIPPQWKSAWQSVALTDFPATPTGKLKVSHPWQHRKLWAP